MKRNSLFIVLATIGTPLFAQTLPAPVTDDMFAPIDQVEAALGRLLFYDPILSGNKNIACATCHHPAFATADGVALAFGEGGVGLGPDRVPDPENIPEGRIPRNAPALFNLGASEFTALFHDGRLEIDPDAPNTIRTPMDADMVDGFASLLSAQTMFPVLSRDEMAGGFRENEIGRAVRQGLITGKSGAWDLIARRVAGIDTYAASFKTVYTHIEAPSDIAFTDISNAIAVFMAHEWRSDTAPFDDVLRGMRGFEGAAADGMQAFYGDKGCSTCHSGPFLTDHRFHVMAAPQIGPGKSATFEDHSRDDGRFIVTGDPKDRFAFRTPSLRNVALTAPYGHAGAHSDLGQFISSHSDAAAGLRDFDIASVSLPVFEGDDFSVLRDAAQVAEIAQAVTTKPVSLSDADVQNIVAFLDKLTDPVAVIGRMGSPESVPSGLPVPKLPNN